MQNKFNKIQTCHFFNFLRTLSLVKERNVVALYIMKRFGLFLFAGFILNTSYGQQDNIGSIHTDFVKKERRQKFDNYLLNNTIDETFSWDVDEESEDAFESSCLSATQFQIKNESVKQGLNKLLGAYDSLSYSTKRALLAAIYSLYPTEYQFAIQQLLNKETNPKLLAIEGVYLSRIRTDYQLQLTINTSMQKIGGYDTLPVLNELKKYISSHQRIKSSILPPIPALFAYQKQNHVKTIYSFQRWNRDYAGIAIVQLEDGNFAKDEDGNLLVFHQLARAATNLPYFLTNGNTPQGIFSIRGTDVSRNLLIGPTPNIQTLLPFEKDSIYWFMLGYGQSPNFNTYLGLMPASWRNYVPMTEAYYAGKCGRSEIIMHGTTIESKYFKDQSYFPLAPTDGCLCANEEWDSETGYLKKSDQLGLVNTFNRTPERRGLLFVINLSNENRAVQISDIEPYVRAFEKM